MLLHVPFSTLKEMPCDVKAEDNNQHFLVGKLVTGQYSYSVTDKKPPKSPHGFSSGNCLLKCNSFVVLKVEEVPNGTLFKVNFPNALTLKVLTVPEGVTGWVDCYDPAWLTEITEEEES